jgi:hypothetical protein
MAKSVVTSRHCRYIWGSVSINIKSLSSAWQLPTSRAWPFHVFRARRRELNHSGAAMRGSVLPKTTLKTAGASWKRSPSASRQVDHLWSPWRNSTLAHPMLRNRDPSSGRQYVRNAPTTGLFAGHHLSASRLEPVLYILQTFS